MFFYAFVSVHVYKHFVYMITFWDKFFINSKGDLKMLVFNYY